MKLETQIRSVSLDRTKDGPGPYRGLRAAGGDTCTRAKGDAIGSDRRAEQLHEHEGRPSRVSASRSPSGDHYAPRRLNQERPEADAADVCRKSGRNRLKATT